MFFNFLIKMTSWACLLGPGLKMISHWKAQSLIFFKLLFSSFAEEVTSCVTENGDASSANNFPLKDRSPDKLLMYIKNNNGPKMEPAVTFHHSDVWPLRRTVCFISLKKLDKRSKRLPDITSLYWYIGSLRIPTNTYTTALTTKQVAKKILFSPCLIEHTLLSQMKMTYTKKRWNKASVKGEWISEKH